MTIGSEKEIFATARAVLEANRAGNSTKPSLDLYPHQWMWDSCFIAIGVSRYDAERAENELEALLRGQWSNGMVPQIVFNPDSTGYFPGPDTWQTSRSPYAPKNVQTSGITQPPILATAALHVYQNDPDSDRAEAFVREVYPKIVAYHDFLYRERDCDGSGLITVVHPWESGLDNSPPYLDAGSRVQLTYKPQYTRLDVTHVAAANRPSNKDYDLFVWLLEQMRAVDYDWNRYLPTAELQVEDVLFNAILCVAEGDLARLAEEVDAPSEDRDRFHKRAHKTAYAIDALLWSDEHKLYFSRDRRTGKLLEQVTIASLMPLYRHDVESERAHALLAACKDPVRFWPVDGFALPTTALNSKWFNAENYWLGPVWVNTNWLLIQGLERSEIGRDVGARLRNDTIGLVKKSGYREYFNPFTGQGYGTDSFSWSAALAIDLIEDDNWASGPAS